MEARSRCSYLMEDTCFNNFLIRYGTLKFNVFFLLRWWRNRASTDSKNGESGKREITWKRTEQKSYTEYNHTRAVRIKARFVKNTVKLLVVGMKLKKICKELLLTSPAKMSRQILGKKLWNMSQKLCQRALLRRKVLCVPWQNLLE